QSDSIGSLTIFAHSTIDADTDVFAAAFGGIAVSFNFAFIDIKPNVRASIGTGTHVDATGNVTVKAATSHDGDGKVFTFTGGAGATGVSWTDVEVAPIVDVYIAGGGTVIDAGGAIEVIGLHNRDAMTFDALTDTWSVPVEGTGSFVDQDFTVNRGARAYSESPAIGAFVAAGTISRAKSNAQVDTRVAAGATLRAGGAVNVESHTVNDARVRAQAQAFAGVSLGATEAFADSNGTTQARLNGNVQSAAGGVGAASVNVTADSLDIVEGEARTT